MLYLQEQLGRIGIKQLFIKIKDIYLQKDMLHSKKNVDERLE